MVGGLSIKLDINHNEKVKPIRNREKESKRERRRGKKGVTVLREQRTGNKK